MRQDLIAMLLLHNVKYSKVLPYSSLAGTEMPGNGVCLYKETWSSLVKGD